MAAFGAVLIALGIGSFLIQLFVSFRNREALRDTTGDPWDGRTLEWSTSSPPPAYNFAFTPVVYDNDTWDDMKKNGYVRPENGFIPIHMPKNTGAGFILAALSALVAYFLLRPTRPGLWLPTGLLVGGAIGNLIDRLANGSVTDFIKLPLWPAFNVSDMAITFGVLALVYVLEGPGHRGR